MFVRFRRVNRISRKKRVEIVRVLKPKTTPFNKCGGENRVRKEIRKERVTKNMGFKISFNDLRGQQKFTCNED